MQQQSQANQPTSNKQTHNPKIRKAELRRLEKLHLFELAAKQKGFSSIAGVDEAGRGPLAGPVVAAACIIPEGILFPGIDDSKKLTPIKRKELFERITSDERVCYAVGSICHQQIDQVNIYQATILAMLQAIAGLKISPDYLLVDGLKLAHPEIPSEKIVNGDQLSHSIAAASIIAKETRDRIMDAEHERWPQYGFNRNKGYGTPEHLKALEIHGPCAIHRHSFAPIKKN